MMYPLCTLNFRFFLHAEGVVLMENRSMTAHSSVFWATPLEQFELLAVAPSGLFGMLVHSGAYAMGSLAAVLALALALAFAAPTLRGRSSTQTAAELVVQLTANFLVANATRAQLPHLPLLLLLVVTLGVYNLGGLFPFGFTFSAHLLCTLAYGFGVFFGLNYVALGRYGVAYFQLFLPGGTPLGLLPLLVGLELVSYFSRPLSLAIRLFANLMAGHALLKILLSFACRGLAGGALPLLLSLLGLALIGLILAMEGLVALLQVFVFVTLVSLYLVDAHNPTSH